MEDDYVPFVDEILSLIHTPRKLKNGNRVILKVTLRFTPISSAFGPYPLFQWYPQSNEILLNLGMKCWNSAFNAQGSRAFIVVVQVGAMNMYVAAVEALRKMETQGETQFTTKKIGGRN